MKILDVGCGNAKTTNAIGIDSNPTTQADVIHDLNLYSKSNFLNPLAEKEFRNYETNI